jgi:hypothetical protein
MDSMQHRGARLCLAGTASAEQVQAGAQQHVRGVVL